MQLGVYTFVETRLDPKTGEPVDVAQTFAELLEQIELADRVGLDVFGLGEHHRPDYAISAPAVTLAAGAARTKRIRLTSAVTVLSLRRSGARLSGIRDARPHLGRPGGDHGRARRLHRILPALRLRPRALRRALRREARASARDPQAPASRLARRLAPAARRPGRLSARAAGSPARLDRLGRHAAIGGAGGRPRPAAGARHHRRRAGPLRAARRALSRGGERARASRRAR